MTKQKNPKDPNDPGDANHSQEPNEPYPNGEGPEPDPEAEGDIVRIHREYVERRLKGGAPATPQAYARAMAQWQRLPGSLPSLPATDLAQAQEEAMPPMQSIPEAATDTQNKEQKS